MACAIAKAGWSLSVWARRPGSLAVLEGLPHAVHATVADLGRRCDVVGLCLRDDGDFEEVVVGQGLLEAMQPGAVVVNHATGSPEACRSFEAKGLEHDVAVLDAPVSGGREGAIAATLTTMVGGERSAFDRCEPVFAAFSRLTAYLGPAGSGQLAKLMNNAMFAANLKNAEEMLETAEGLGFDLTGLVELILASSGRSFALEAIAHHIRPELVAHYQAMVGKDVRYLSDAARDRGVPRSALEDRAEQGVADLDAAVRRSLGQK